MTFHLLKKSLSEFSTELMLHDLIHYGQKRIKTQQQNYFFIRVGTHSPSYSTTSNELNVLCW